MKKLVTLLSLIWLVAATAEARDLEDILKEKKVIDPIEANEAKAAKEREQAAAEKAAQSLPSLPSWLKMVTLFGDVRIRNEDFFRKGDTDRNRDRVSVPGWIRQTSCSSALSLLAAIQTIRSRTMRHLQANLPVSTSMSATPT